MQPFALEKKIYAWALLYFLLTTLLHWRLHPDLGIILYLVGAVIGLHLLELIERGVNMTPSPFRTMLSQTIVAILTIFVLTSSSNPLGKGVVLFMNLRYLFLQWKEFSEMHTLAAWGTPVKLQMDEKTSRLYIYLLWFFLGIVTILFILT